MWEGRCNKSSSSSSKSSNKYPNLEKIGVHCSSSSSPPPASEVPGRNRAVTLEDPSLKQQGRVEACTRLTCICSQLEEEEEEEMVMSLEELL
jgi:hypothetical protein